MVADEGAAVQEVDNEVDSIQSVNQREPALILHIFGPPKSKALVQFGNLPEKTTTIATKRRGSNRIVDKPLPPPMARQVICFTGLIKNIFVLLTN